MTTEAPSLWDRGPFDPCPPRFNLARHTLASVDTTPGKAALEVVHAPGRATVLSFADVAGRVGGAMGALAGAGVGPGDRILLRLGHSLDFPVAFFAAVGLGALPVPTSPQLTAPEVLRIVDTIRPRLAIAAPDLTGSLPSGLTAIPPPGALGDPGAFADTGADDPAYIVFTSGTGGQARAVVHAHRAGWARRMMWRDWYDLRADDRLLHAGAFNWTFTLGTGITDPWAAGATALIYDGPANPAVWADIAAAHGPTIFAAAPGVFRQLLASGTVTEARFRTLRHALTAGEALPPRIRRAWEDATGKPIFEALGMSEVSTYASQSPRHAGLRPQRGRRVAVLVAERAVPLPRGVEGRLAVSARDPGLMLGYWSEGGIDLPLAGEWFLTGDRAVMATDGSLTHRGRAGDLMNAQGYRVSAAEVEAALLDHPDVAEAAVLALRVRADVEVIAAFVVPDPHAGLTETAVEAHCAARLARYKCPRVIEILDDLPKTPTGKVLKGALRQRFGFREDP